MKKPTSGRQLVNQVLHFQTNQSNIDRVAKSITTTKSHQKVHLATMNKALHYIKKIEKFEDKNRELSARNKEKELASLKVKMERVILPEHRKKGKVVQKLGEIV